MTKAMTIDRAHGGPGWQSAAVVAGAAGARTWGAFGAASECGKLERVLLSYPHAAVAAVTDPEAADWTTCPDVARLRRQIDDLAEIYDRHAVDVTLIEPDGAPMTNSFFMRDLFVMTPSGAILSHLASPVRWGEEVFAYTQLADLRVPVVASVVGEATFEGPDVVFFDDDAAFVATSVRSNPAGAAQVAACLAGQGIEAVMIQTTYGCGHLDGVLAIVDRKTAVVFPKRLSFTAYDHLVRRGYSIVALPSLEEAEDNMAINMVALEPGLVVMPADCPKTKDALRDAGVHVLTADVSEAMKAGGAMHCMTAIIKRGAL